MSQESIQPVRSTTPHAWDPPPEFSDEPSGRFLVQDLSKFGTTVDGVALPRTGEAGGEPPESPLPERAVLQLAGAVILEFQAELRR